MTEPIFEIDDILLSVIDKMELKGYETKLVRLTPWANIHFRINEKFIRNHYTLQVIIEDSNNIRVEISDLWDTKKKYNYDSIEKFEKGINRNLVNKVRGIDYN